MATDVGHAKMISLLQQFKDRVTREHVALFFFAGHGVTVNNESFLIPVDAPAEIELDDKGDPRAESSNTSPCQDVVRAYAARSIKDWNCVPRCLQDECGPTRTEPDLSLRFVSLQTTAQCKSCEEPVSMEIKPSPYSAGVFRAYATQLDNVASDGVGRNSPFTKALAQAYWHQGNLDPGADDTGAQGSNARNCEQASSVGGSCPQREFLLRFAGCIVLGHPSPGKAQQ